MKKSHLIVPAALALATPFFAAADGINTSVLQGYSTTIITVINTILVPLVFAIAFIVFIYGVYKYFILGATEEGAKGEGRQWVLWGIIGFVVILSVWGLVNVVASVFNFNSVTVAPNVPKL